MNALKTALLLLSIFFTLASCRGIDMPEPIPPVSPEAVIFEPEGFKIEASNSSAFALIGGSLWGWGSNSSGQMGNGRNTAWMSPHVNPLHIIDDIAYVSAGGIGIRTSNVVHVMVIRTDGSLWGWGRNCNGQVGDGTLNMRAEPIFIMDGIISVSTGGMHTMAICSDNILWGWGCNCTGKLGNGTYYGQHVPMRIMDNVAYVYAGERHTMAIQLDGTLWTWGWGIAGALGTGEFEDSTIPVKIMEDIISASAGGRHSLAICSNNSLWAWGHNEWGQLGVGNFDTIASPIHVMDDVIAAFTGYGHSMAIRSDNSLWAWGHNSWGQLGDGTQDNSHTPIHIMDNVINVSVGKNWDWHAYTIVTKEDNSLWAWGDNHFGQLGDGEYGQRYSQIAPVEMRLIMDWVAEQSIQEIS
ncbi:MAG: hypothetical protein FWC73_00495 [Defluviitaleaceae bacterium]|nr:hypothetical protein [Defluviitaleaceae bacterium]